MFPHIREKATRKLIGKTWSHSSVLTFTHKWHTDTIYEIDLVKVQDMGLKFYQIFSYAVVHFGDVPAECIARVVAYDENDLNGNFILQSLNTDGQTKELLQYQEEDAEVCVQ